ncbi:MAG TPA: hypothetical protein VK034_23420 [Enhygromyxa sp.]|nr:hypothetical protein [Enhygromyxa sp.]
MRAPHVLALILLAACASEDPDARTGPEVRIELDERPVLIGDVIERVDSDAYVYLRLSIVSDSAAPRMRPHARERWVALDGAAPRPGERVRVRSLARRRDVWDRTLAREFEVLEYVAALD